MFRKDGGPDGGQYGVSAQHTRTEEGRGYAYFFRGASETILDLSRSTTPHLRVFTTTLFYLQAVRHHLTFLTLANHDSLTESRSSSLCTFGTGCKDQMHHNMCFCIFSSTYGVVEVSAGNDVGNSRFIGITSLPWP